MDNKKLIAKYKKLRDKYKLMSKDFENDDCLFWGNVYRVYQEVVKDLENAD